MSEDTNATFNDLYRRINAKDKQILSTEILAQGDLPVVDQGKSQIAGYTNNLAKRFTPPDGGVIVFGDHTRIVKFVDFDFAIGADGTQLIAARGDNDTRFLAFLLSAQEVPNTGYNRHFKFLKEMTFSVPPLPEQQAIAAALSDADGVVAGLERVIAKKRLIKQGAMQDLLTARRRLPGFSGEWVQRKLGTVAMLQRGFDLPNSIRQDGVYPVVYSNGVMATHSAFMCEGPGVVTGRSGTIGNVTFVAGQYWPHNTALWVKNFFRNSPRFIYYLLEFIDLRRFASGSGVPTLNRNDAHDDIVFVPKDIDEQKAICSVLDDMDAEIQTLESRLAKARAVKEGMMQNLLTGRVRLV